MRILSMLAVALSLVFATLLQAAPGDKKMSPLVIEAGSGKHTFNVELALTADQQAKGLMYRRTLAPDAGMLFVYARPSPVTMWMKNTYIPLDMLFIGADGRILHMVERTVPLSTELIGSDKAIRAVLELNGGTASRLGIRTGDRVVHPALQ